MAAGTAPYAILSRDLTLLELGQKELLRGVEPLHLERVLEAGDHGRVEQGTLLVEAHGRGGYVYIILEGRVAVYLRKSEIADDNAQPVAEIGAGATVGELALLDPGEHSAYVVAKDECRVLAIRGDDFLQLVEDSHQVALNLLSTLSKRLRGNNARLDEVNERERRYKKHAYVDSLTGLYNRRYLDEMLDRSMQRSARAGSSLTIAMIDVDFFKRLNDTHGHAAGDLVLVEMGARLRATCRPLDLVARYGGEEFTVIFAALGAENARRAAERLRAAICSKPFALSEVLSVDVSVSVGIATLAAESEPADLVARADGALYVAKQQGRNRVEVG